MRSRREGRAYGQAHKSLRRQWAALVAQGNVTCARCGQLIRPNEEWHLDHSDDRRGYLGPSHALCNTTAPHRGRYEGTPLQRENERRRTAAGNTAPDPRPTPRTTY